MRKNVRILALLLALIMLVPGMAAAETETTQEDMLLFTVDGVEYTSSQVSDMMQTLYEYGYIASEEDYYSTIEYMLYTVAEQKKLTEMGFDQFTDAETEAFMQEAEEELSVLVDEWVEYYRSGEETEEELTELRASVVDYFASMGYDAAVIAEELKYNAAFDKMVAHLEETNDLSVTKEDVQVYFDEGVELDRQEYENDVAKYEMYTTYYGVESWYIPEGYRGVLQILLEVDETLLNDYLTKLESYQASLSGEESVIEVTEENTEEIPATEADVKAAYDAAMASCQDTIDEIYRRLDNGEKFVDLIPEYNIDPGMMNEETLAEGYMAHPESYMDEAFLEAVFSEKMQKPGDVSDPSLGMYGIYITYYLREIESGAVELTDELYASIESMLHSEKLSTLYNSLIAEWVKECEVVYNEENLLSVTGLQVQGGVLLMPETDETVIEQE